MSYSTRVDDAFLFAADKHRAQLRKGAGVPYLTHLMAVAACVGEHGGSEDQVIAALLHDVIEDQGVTRDEIATRFGDDVATIVAACTDAWERPKPPWRARKEAHLAHLRDASVTVKLVVVSDKLHNARSILRDLRTIGPRVWTRFTASRTEMIWYLRSMAQSLRTAWPHPLIDELDEVVNAIEAYPQ
jgi:(p)ppGpp synthase/HD superfamily hydrolase